MQEEKWQGKRLEKRVQCEHPIQFEMSAKTLENPTKRFDGRCIDISNYGAGIITEHALESSQVIKLYLPMKNTNTAMPVFAQVIWTAPDNGRTRTGVRFLV
jgi:hypothetical protein